MPQVLKDEVRERIVDAARDAFAEDGFAAATVASIARQAGVSTGNIYRYFGGKDDLFEAAVPPRFVARFRELLRGRLDALAGVRGDYRHLPEDHAYPHAAEELLTYCLEHRRAVLAVLARGEETRWAGVRNEVVTDLVAAAERHFGAEGTAGPRHFGLERIFGAFLDTVVAALERYPDPAEVRVVLDAVADYHRVGLSAYFR